MTAESAEMGPVAASVNENGSLPKRAEALKTEKQDGDKVEKEDPQQESALALNETQDASNDSNDPTLANEKEDKENPSEKQSLHRPAVVADPEHQTPVGTDPSWKNEKKDKESLSKKQSLHTPVVVATPKHQTPVGADPSWKNEKKDKESPSEKPSLHTPVVVADPEHQTPVGIDKRDGLSVKHQVKEKSRIVLKAQMDPEQKKKLIELAAQIEVDLERLSLHALVAKMNCMLQSEGLEYNSNQAVKDQVVQELALLKAIEREESRLISYISVLFSLKDSYPSVLSDLIQAKEDLIILLVLKEEVIAEISKKAAYVDLSKNSNPKIRLKATMPLSQQKYVKQLACDIGIDLKKLHLQALVDKAQQLITTSKVDNETDLSHVIMDEENLLKGMITELNKRKEDPSVQTELMRAKEEAILLLIVKQELVSELETKYYVLGEPSEPVATNDDKLALIAVEHI